MSQATPRSGRPHAARGPAPAVDAGAAFATSGRAGGDGPGVRRAVVPPLALALVSVASVALALSGASPVPIVGGPCENCEHVFEGMPETIPTSTHLAPGESGDPLTVRGVVHDAAGEPRAGVVVYAYQTDAEGIYPGRSRTWPHGTLRGWVRTDAEGRYEIHTVRPGGYPGSSVAQHIHLHVIEPACTYWIGDVLFEDDPRLDEAERRRARGARGGSGLVAPQQVDGGDGWSVSRDIELGRGVPGYERCHGG